MRFAHVIAAKAGTATSPPPPPPPPPGGFVDIAELRVGASGGNVDLGVPISPDFAIVGPVKSVLLNGSIVAQADRGTTDRDGYARWFHLSASQLSANTTYTISVSTDAEASSPVTFSDVAATTIGANGATFTSTDAIAAGLVYWWRRGPVVSEGVYDHEIVGNAARVRFLVSKWAHGESRAQTFIDNAYTILGTYNTTGPEQLLHDITCARSGSTSESFADIIHPCFATVQRNFGSEPVFATIQAIGFSGSADQGEFEYLRDSRMYQNYRTRFAAPTFAIASFQTSAPASPTEGARYTPDVPFQKSFSRQSGVWVPSNDGYQHGFVGPITCRNTAGGDDVDIGQHPLYYQQAVSNWDASARAMMLNCVRKRIEIPTNYRLSTTKKLPRTDNNVDYVRTPLMGSQVVGGSKYLFENSDGAALANSTTFTSATGGFTADMVGMPIYFTDGIQGEEFRRIVAYNSSTSVTIDRAIWTTNQTGITFRVNAEMANQYWEQSHWGAVAYLPYLMTGEYACLDLQLRQELHSYIWSPYGDGNPANSAHGFFRSGQYRHPAQCYWDQYYDVDPGVNQERHQGWAVRTTVHTCAIMPDDENLTLALWGWDKSMVRERLANVQTGLYNCFVVGSTGPGKRFTSSPVGCRFLPAGPGPEGYPQNSWMHGTIGVSWCMAKWLGELTSNGFDFIKWLLDGHAALYADSTNPAMREYLYGSDGNVPTTKDGLFNYWASPGQPSRTWLEVYTYFDTYSPTDFPDPGHANWNKAGLGDPDWFGYRLDMMADAVSFGCTQGTDAYDWCLSAAAHFNSGNTYVYSVAHDIAPRSL